MINIIFKDYSDAAGNGTGRVAYVNDNNELILETINDTTTKTISTKNGVAYILYNPSNGMCPFDINSGTVESLTQSVRYTIRPIKATSETAEIQFYSGN